MVNYIGKNIVIKYLNNPLTFKIPKASISQVTDDYLEGRTLLWEDNFETFDETMWTRGLKPRCPNGQLQCYDPDQIEVSDGSMKVKLTYFPDGKEVYKGISSKWHGAMCELSGIDFQYGRIEFKAKFPTCQGVAAAIWALGNQFKIYNGLELGQTFPICGEIDMIEQQGFNPPKPYLHRYDPIGNCLNSTNCAYNNYPVNKESENFVDHFKNNYHIYALEWTKDLMQFYVDGVLYSKAIFSSQNLIPNYTDYLTDVYDEYYSWEGGLFNKPFKFYFTIGCNGNASGPLAPGDYEEKKIEIDWVRLYAPKENYKTVKVTSLTFENIEDNSELLINDNRLIRYKFHYENEKDDDTFERILDKTLTWESSDDKICKVLGGRLRPIRPGRVTITATTKYLDDSGQPIKASCNIEFKQFPEVLNQPNEFLSEEGYYIYRYSARTDIIEAKPIVPSDILKEDGLYVFHTLSMPSDAKFDVTETSLVQCLGFKSIPLTTNLVNLKIEYNYKNKRDRIQEFVSWSSVKSNNIRLCVNSLRWDDIEYGNSERFLAWVKGKNILHDDTLTNNIDNMNTLLFKIPILMNEYNTFIINENTNIKIADYNVENGDAIQLQYDFDIEDSFTWSNGVNLLLDYCSLPNNGSLISTWNSKNPNVPWLRSVKKINGTQTTFGMRVMWSLPTDILETNDLQGVKKWLSTHNMRGYYR